MSVAVRNEKILGGVSARKLQRALNFRQRFEGRKGGVKATLMNQNLLAGIGSVYSDKIHFQARLHPETRGAHLAVRALEELHKEIWRVLETAIEREADPHKLPGLLPAFSQVRRREVPAGQR
jgi:formamidopyrimidine-DNA glycosylase